MKPLKRNPVSKHSSAVHFRHNVSHTKAINVTAPMRGGIRM